MLISSWTSVLDAISHPIDQVNLATEQALDGVACHTPPAALAMLSDLQVLGVNGSDRHKFLQGQLTCDVNEVAQGKLVLGAQCNLKGRAYGSGFLLEYEDTTLIILPAGQAAYFSELLAKFAVFSKVELALRDDLLVFGLLGSASDWRQRGLTLSPTVQQSTISNGAYIANLGGDASLWLGVAEPDKLEALLKPAEADAVPQITSAEPWHLARMQLGIGLIWPDAREQWIPQELNYDQIGAVSFKKGCYKGQEVIARIYYRGQVKQRLALFRTESRLPIAVNDYVIAGHSQKHIGQVIETRSLVNGQIFLAVVQRDALESTTVFLEQNDPVSGPALCPAYAINNEYFS